LWARGLSVPLDANGSIKVPIRAGTPVGAGFVGEAQPIPVSAGALSSVTLAPKKTALITVFSRELARYASAEAIFTEMLREASGVTIDLAFFGTQAASAAAHAGILNGVTATTGPGATMADDLGKLSETACAAGSGRAVFVMSPGRFASATVRAAIT